MFSPDLLEKIDHFIENERHVNYLVQDLLKMVDEVEETSLNIFSYFILAKYSLALSRSPTVILLTNAESFRFSCSLFRSFSSGNRLWIGMCWGQVLILEYFFTDCNPPILLKVSWSRFDERLGLDSNFHGVSPEWNFEKQFRTWQFCVVSVTFLFLYSHNITCWICTFSSSILEAWDH